MNRFRPLILSLILAAAAFGLTRLNAALQASPPVISGASGSVLFASAFDDYEREWETFDGRLSSTVEGGILKIDVGTENAAPFVPARWHFGDFDLRVTAAAVGGPPGRHFRQAAGSSHQKGTGVMRVALVQVGDKRKSSRGDARK